MLDDTISKIEGRIRSSDAVNENHRAELLKLLGELRGEISALARTHTTQAQSIATYAEASARAATSQTRDPATLQTSLGGLESSVGEFEETHPQLVGIVNRIAATLANMGI
jgi:hypothetical protein